MLRVNATRVSVPDYFPAFDPDRNPGHRYIAWQTWRRDQAAFFLNHLLTDRLGLRAGAGGTRVLADESFRLTHGLAGYPEGNALLGLSFLPRKGWRGGITSPLVCQYRKGRSAPGLGFRLVRPHQSLPSSLEG